jgi:dimethylhistidine N-methyltransferase
MDVLAGFEGRPQRTIPARWLYDLRGSELFEEITRLADYYPSRVETFLLRMHSGEIAERVGQGRAIVEFGSGSSTKTSILLEQLAPAAYVPIDISGEFMRQSIASLSAAFPTLPILPIEGDYTRTIAMPQAIRHVPKLGFFPGSTIGNQSAYSAIDLLRAIRRSLGIGAALLIGIDLIKEERSLVRAYDDRDGVTAAFNLNLLHRINRELDATIPVAAFRHVARWNAHDCRIEMHLEAVRDVAFTIDGRRFMMAAGETLHTENSHKYCLAGARLLLRSGGWQPLIEWVDAKSNFALLLAEAPSFGAEP